ncbi:conserved unknown protein [Ectocarpus siliculosus]|uniref:Uncharacterized protein n=1 Tax=Ectocarpus siliculosus TaxID=2880 RepID=D7FLM0_ECTSI|nr:conserved unknown protein [Ectocarpus siliculosus]|eukprot:CBJ25836.1 conserved unknown protein [Ectocarpus siliculosus]
MSRRLNSIRRSGGQEQQQPEEQPGPLHGRVEEDGTLEPMDGFSEYEIERRRTMERNHRRLQELGLVGREKVVMAGPVVKPPRRGSRAVLASGAAAATVGVRKSLRTRNKPAPVYTEHAVGFDDERDREQKRRRLSPVNEQQGWEQASLSIPTAVPPTPARRSTSQALPPNSSRNLECNIPMLMERYLGRQFLSFGKAPVMELSTKTCPPKFSRMSGVTEWKNAVFLWVNVDGGTGYTNLFEEDKLPEAADDAESTKNGGDIADKSRREVPVTGSKKPVIGGVADNQLQRDQKATATVGAATAAACRRPTSPRSVKAPSIRGGSGIMAGNDDTAAIGNFAGDGGRDGAAWGDGGGATCDRSTGLRMTWFAGGRMTAESALIQRLLAGRDPPETEDQPSEAVDADASSETTMSTSAPAACGRDLEQNRHDSGSAVAMPVTTTTTSEAAGEMNSGTAHAPCPKPQADVEGLEAKSAETTAAVAEHGALHGPILRASASPGDGVEGDGGKSGDVVLLFCRLPNEPYVFCGRLGYSKHWAGERPVRFVWRLIDAAGLTKRPDFKAILEAAGIGSADPS